MSEFLIPEKVLVINDSTKYPALFRDNANAVVAAASATQYHQEGIGTTKIAQVTKARLVRGQVPTNERWSITAATAGEITVTGPIPNNTLVFFEFVVRSTKRQFSLQRPEYQFGQTFRFPVNMNTGDTAGIILAKLYNAITVDENAKERFMIVDSGTTTAGTFVNGLATTLTELEVVLRERGSYITEFKAVGVDNLASNYITVFNPTRIQAVVAGIGYGSDVEFREKLTYANNEPYFYDFSDIPQENALYTEASWTISVNRTHPTSPNMSNQIRVVLYINQNNCEPFIDNLADYFDQFPGTEFDAIVGGVYTKDTTAANFKTNA